MVWSQISLGKCWSLYGIESNRKMGGKAWGRLWPCQSCCTVVCGFIRKLFGKLTLLPYITLIRTLLCINASSSPSLLFLQYPQPDYLVQCSCYVLYHSYDLGDFTLACRFLPAQLGTHTLNLPFYWHRWEKEKPISDYVSWTLKIQKISQSYAEYRIFFKIVLCFQPSFSRKWK